jgi:two-component system LytT family response regulator
MIKAIIIEDEERAASLLEAMVTDIDPNIQIAAKCGDLSSGIRTIHKYHPEIVFLDIDLPVHSGMEILDFFNPEEITFNIIFVTASNAYAVRAFEMSAADYITKPIEATRLELSIRKVVARNLVPTPGILPAVAENYHKEGLKRIVVYDEASCALEILMAADTYYFQAFATKTKIHRHSLEAIMVNKNIGYFAELLVDSQHFFKVHKTFLVNLDYVKTIKKNTRMIVLRDPKNTTIPVAIEKMTELLERIRQIS